MSDIVKRFSEYLEAIEYPKQKTSWNIAGILKGQNAFYRFDVRDMIKLQDGTQAQTTSFNSQAEKMVLEKDKQWIIFDLNELHKYGRSHNKKKVFEEELISKLEWTIFLKKN